MKHWIGTDISAGKTASVVANNNNASFLPVSL
jgi:hypothetical protein